MSKSSPHLLLAGYFGFDNAGDEAIFESMVCQFRRLCPDVRLSALTHDVAAAKRLGVEAIPRKSPGRVWKALRACDVFVQGGGGLFQDSTGRGSVIYYGGLLVMAKLACRPSIVFSQGYGPVKGKLEQLIARAALSLARVVTVRDQESYDELQALGLDESRLFVTADPALLLEPLPVDEMRQLLTQEGLLAEMGRSELPDGRPSSAGPLVAIALRSWPTLELLPLAEALKMFQEKFSARYLLLPLQRQSDLEPSRRLAEFLEGKAKVLESPISPRALTGILSCCDMVFGMRLHSLILASVGNPVLFGLSYDPKVERFCRRAGALSCSVEGISSERLLKEWEHLLCGRKSQRSSQGRAIKAMREDAGKAFSAALCLASRGRAEDIAEVFRG